MLRTVARNTGYLMKKSGSRSSTSRRSSSSASRKPRFVVALGGNALVQPGQKGTLDETRANAEIACRALAGLVEKGNEVVVTHGNGPQVGAIVLQNQIAAEKVPEMPLAVCGAQTQGYLGQLLQCTLRNELQRVGLKDRDLVSLVTQVLVDPADPSFQTPTKPIGAFYTDAEAEPLMAQGVPMAKDPKHGWRKVVASPKPAEIVEKAAVKQLLSAGFTVIAAGGGGVPVVRDSAGQLTTREAVIDKDMTGALLAREVDADMLLILTDVDAAYTDWNDATKRKRISCLSIKDAKALATSGEFAAGSMGPKVAACISFTEATGRPSIITSLNTVMDALDSKSGTRVVP